MTIVIDDNEKYKGRLKKVTIVEFKTMLLNKEIRGASLEDVYGTHHKRDLYKHPHTGQLYVKI